MTEGARTALAAALAALAGALLVAGDAGAAVGDVTYFPLDSTCCEAKDIAPGPDGNLWFTVPEDNKFGWITTSGEVHEVEVFPDHPDSERPDEPEPTGITAGPDGSMWFTEPGAFLHGEIGRFPTFGTNRTLAEVDLPHCCGPPSRAERITAGPDGNLWFTDPTRHFNVFGSDIWRITVGGEFTRYPVPGEFVAVDVNDITGAADGNLWFTESIGDSVIGRITPSGAFTRYDVSDHFDTDWVTPGPDGNIWFTETGDYFTDTAQGGKIGRITPSGALTEFAVPEEYAHPRVGDPLPGRITAGCDGNLYFTITAADRGIVRITTDGEFTGFFSTEPHGAKHITAGPDGNLWFTSDTENIGRLELCPAPSEAEPALPTLSVSTTGGVVWSSPPGISCGDVSAPDCEADFLPGVRVTLTASPSFDAVFLGWGSDCAGSPASPEGGTCELTMDTDKVVSAGFHPGAYRPDAMIRHAGETSYTGNNGYNTTAVGQTSDATARPGETRVFHVRVENDGLLSDAYDLHGCGSSKRFSVSYFLGSTSKDITRPVVKGTYVLPPSASLLSPGDARGIRVVMRMAKGRGAWTSDCLVTATSRSGFSDAWEFAGGQTPPTTKKDAVRARVKVG